MHLAGSRRGSQAGGPDAMKLRGEVVIDRQGREQGVCYHGDR